MDNDKIIKLIKRSDKMNKWLVNVLGVTYVGYLNLLMNTLNYDNEVDFLELRELGVKDGMLKVVRKKLIESNLIAKKGSRFYLNPMIAVKGEVVDQELIDLFNKK